MEKQERRVVFLALHCYAKLMGYPLLNLARDEFARGGMDGFKGLTKEYSSPMIAGYLKIVVLRFPMR